MKTISISNFNGGVDDPRSTATNVASSVRNFITGRTKLTPYSDTETEALDTGTLANQKLTDAIRYNYTGSTTQIFGLGRQGVSFAYPKIYQKSTVNDPNATFQAASNGEDTSGSVIPGTLIGYKGAIYCLKSKSGSVYLVKHVYGTSMTEIGAVGADSTNGVTPQMFIHPKDNRLYMASGYTAASYDGTTLATRDFSTAHNINSITFYGNNIVLGMVSKDSNSSVLAIWSGSTTSSELVDVVDFGNDTVMVLDNLGDVVIGVSGISVGGSSDVGIQNTVTIRGYAGGAAQTLKTLDSIGSLGSRVYPLKAKRNNVLYFPMSAYLNGTRVHQVWAFYKNSDGNWACRPDRKLNNNSEVVSETITGLSLIGDYIWIALSDGTFRKTANEGTYTTTCSYETTANPSMETGDRSKNKQLKVVSLRCGSPSGASHTVTLSYSIDTGTTWNTIYSGASSNKIRVIEAINESTGKPFEVGREYMFKIESTGNGEIYEFKYGYEVLPTLI